MPDFSRPEYASYVQLCRELRLKREFREGDAVWVELGPGDATGLSWVSSRDVKPDHPRSGSGFTWLPSLSDWLEMLEAAGIGVIEIERRDDRYIAIGAERAWDCEWSCSGATHVEAPTCEEAAARLWMTVRG